MEEELKKFDGMEVPTEEQFRQFRTQLFEVCSAYDDTIFLNPITQQIRF